MAVEVRDPSGLIEKINALRFNSVGAEHGFPSAGVDRSIRDIYLNDVLQLTEAYTDLIGAGIPMLSWLRRISARTITGISWPSGGRRLTGPASTFSSADLGRCFRHASWDGGVFLVRITNIVSDTQADVDRNAGSAGSGASLVLGYRRLREAYDNGAGTYNDGIYGSQTVIAEHEGQTGDLWTLKSATGSRLIGFPVAGVPSGATDVATVGHVSTKSPKIANVTLYPADTDVANGTKIGGILIRIPAIMNGYNLSAIGAILDTAATGSPGIVQLAPLRARKATPTTWVSMLSTPLGIPQGDVDSGVDETSMIDTGNDDVATGDRIMFAVTGTYTAGSAKGLIASLLFTKP